MKRLTLEQLLILHQRVIQQSGGASGIRDKGILESALAQPEMSYGGQALCPTIIEKVAALGYSLIQNHPFIDGNKRIGHAAMEVTLLMNGYKIHADVDTQEAVIMAVASSKMNRELFLQWLQQHIVAR